MKARISIAITIIVIVALLGGLYVIRKVHSLRTTIINEGQLISYIETGNVNGVKRAITKSDVDLDRIYDAEGSTPLIIAIRYKRYDIVRILLANGANPNKTDQHGMEPIRLAAIAGDKDVFLLLENNGASLNSITGLVVAAAKGGNIQIIQALLRKGMHVNEVDANGNTPLHNTANVKVAVYLLSRGAGVDIKNGDGDTPLHSSVIDRNVDMVDFLLKNGADTSLRNNRGLTASQLAGQIGERKIELLIIHHTNH